MPIKITKNQLESLQKKDHGGEIVQKLDKILSLLANQPNMDTSILEAHQERLIRAIKEDDSPVMLSNILFVLERLLLTIREKRPSSVEFKLFRKNGELDKVIATPLN